MKQNYNLVSQLKQRVLTIALAALSVTGFSQITYSYNSIGAVQTMTLPPGKGTKCRSKLYEDMLKIYLLKSILLEK